MLHMSSTLVPGHQCAKGKDHYIEFFSKYDEKGEEEEEQITTQEEGYDTI